MSNLIGQKNYLEFGEIGVEKSRNMKNLKGNWFILFSGITVRNPFGLPCTYNSSVYV